MRNIQNIQKYIQKIYTQIYIQKIYKKMRNIWVKVPSTSGIGETAQLHAKE